MRLKGVLFGLAICGIPTICEVKAEEEKVVDEYYIRNSVYMMKMDIPSTNEKYDAFYAIMDKTYDSIDFATRYERYNDFSLENRHIDRERLTNPSIYEYEELGVPDDIKQSDKPEVATLLKYFRDERIANKLVAKWHNKFGIKEGEVDWDKDIYVIRELGLKSLSEEARYNALATENLTSMIGKSESKMVSNTYLCVNRYGFLDAQDIVAQLKAPFEKDLEKLDKENPLLAAGIRITIAAIEAGFKGYFVTANAYLFRLEWNDSIQQDFYTRYWNNPEEFIENAPYKLVYVGKSSKKAPATMSISFDPNTEPLIKRATLRGTDAAFAALQRDNNDFRPMTSLHIVDGKLAAYIGCKEGITKKDKFDVYQATVSGKKLNAIEWKYIGKIKVSNEGVWDNREGAEKEIAGGAIDKDEKKEKGNAKLGCTFFNGSTKKFGEGNLIRLSGGKSKKM